MKRISSVFVIMAALAASLAVAHRSTQANPAGEASDRAPARQAARPTVDQARRQAELLHETVHATLQIVHHQYYREDEGLVIPAATLKRVFAELEKRRQVELRWLAVNAEAMHVGHKPQDDFEKAAVTALAAGKESHEQTADGVYRYAGAITLGSECLKCHLPNRKSTEDRTAGLVIAIPLAEK